MIETVTAVMGLVSVGIFLAHAFEGYRSRAWFSGRACGPGRRRKDASPLSRREIRKALI